MARGFFAELEYQAQLKAKRQAQAQRAAARAAAAATRQAEQARKQYERAHAQEARASAAEKKAAEREAKRLHEEARMAEVVSLNAQLTEQYDQIDSILSATLAVDDFVDLEQLRSVAQHPPFTQPDLEIPTPPPVPVSAPPEPIFDEPAAPKGLGGVFGGKKKHAEAVASARAVFEAEHQKWQAEAATIPTLQLKQMQDHEATEQDRIARLEQATAQYRRQCEEREIAASQANDRLDELITGLDNGVDSAIQEYVGIVLSHSVYPEVFPVAHEFAFDSDLKELELIALVPTPDALPSTKEYRFVRSKDEISAVALPKKELKGRYATALYQTAVRTLHEIFEADRAGHISTVALNVASEGLDPATGLKKRTWLIAVAAERSSFISFDLVNVDPLATLQHLGASVSKSPYDLIEIDGSHGVRQR